MYDLAMSRKIDIFAYHFKLSISSPSCLTLDTKDYNKEGSKLFFHLMNLAVSFLNKIPLVSVYNIDRLILLSFFNFITKKNNATSVGAFRFDAFCMYRSVVGVLLMWTPK
jgi:hypothetical protein